MFKLPFPCQAIIQKIIQMKNNTKKTRTKLRKALKLGNVERRYTPEANYDEPSD